MNKEDLIQLALAVAADRDAWEHEIRHDIEERTYSRLALDDDAEVWLICWSEGHDTGFHDHDGSAGAVAVIDGAVVEERLTVGTDPARRVAHAGEAFFFESFDIHRVRHAGKRPAVTVHAYSPPLRRVGSYVIEPDGRLARHAMDADEELKPIEA